VTLSSIRPESERLTGIFAEIKGKLLKRMAYIHQKLIAVSVQKRQNLVLITMANGSQMLVNLSFSGIHYRPQSKIVGHATYT